MLISNISKDCKIRTEIVLVLRKKKFLLCLAALVPPG